MVLAVSLIGASSAAAATEFGDNCVADDTTEGTQITAFEVSAPGNPLPTAAPSAGVITKWKVALTGEAAGVTVPAGLRVLRVNPAAKTAQVVGEASGNVVAGSNTFDTRIPVQAGDRLGLYGASGLYGTLLCESAGVNVLGAFLGGGGGVGSSVPYNEGPGPVQVPLSAIIEPDADNDGYGDETQDKCPQSAAVQVACPVIVLDSFALAKKSSIVVLVAASESGSVTVSGTAKLPKVSKASSSAKAKLKKVKGNVTAGKIARFTLKFPGNLKSALKSLPRGKSITVKLQATATNVAGQVSKDKAKLKLKG